MFAGGCKVTDARHSTGKADRPFPHLPLHLPGNNVAFLKCFKNERAEVVCRDVKRNIGCSRKNFKKNQNRLRPAPSWTRSPMHSISIDDEIVPGTEGSSIWMKRKGKGEMGSPDLPTTVPWSPLLEVADEMHWAVGSPSPSLEKGVSAQTTRRFDSLSELRNANVEDCADSPTESRFKLKRLREDRASAEQDVHVSLLMILFYFVRFLFSFFFFISCPFSSFRMALIL